MKSAGEDKYFRLNDEKASPALGILKRFSHEYVVCHIQTVNTVPVQKWIFIGMQGKLALAQGANQADACTQVLAWLRCKVKLLRNSLVDSSASFAALGTDALTVYAIGLLGEYLSDDWMQRLAGSCHVSLGVRPSPAS